MRAISIYTIFFILSTLSAFSFAARPHLFEAPYESFGTNLCNHKYDSVGDYYYCGEKIKKVLISFNFDDFYKGKAFDYSIYSKKMILNELQRIKSTVKQFHFDTVNQDLVPFRVMPEKNEVLYHFEFQKPDFQNKKITIVIFAGVNGKFEIMNYKIDFSDSESLENDFKKYFEASKYAFFMHLAVTDFDNRK